MKSSAAHMVSHLAILSSSFYLIYTLNSEPHPSIPLLHYHIAEHLKLLFSQKSTGIILYKTANYCWVGLAIQLTGEWFDLSIFYQTHWSPPCWPLRDTHWLALYSWTNYLLQGIQSYFSWLEGARSHVADSEFAWFLQIECPFPLNLGSWIQSEQRLGSFWPHLGCFRSEHGLRAWRLLRRNQCRIGGLFCERRCQLPRSWRALNCGRLEGNPRFRADIYSSWVLRS